MDPTSDNPLPPGPEDEKPAKRRFNRREVIALVGAGGVAAGFGLAKVLSDDDGGGSSTPGGRAVERQPTATDETSPSTIASRSDRRRPTRRRLTAPVDGHAVDRDVTASP